ncbi:AlbA family DNA-binding domain-containing protein [Halopelagius longus]|uniref:Putative DNA-binding domain-containing protein n=1 Tax=Halopelagius longus TaxID=1236180 RepID=A0A1H0YSV5_9EURY|nr:RNA-binding domain-containing protein [Halopelagius longus]RDI72661.1 hypothetical protein DWB78_13535 [Halopelagius longus]SDQ18249.1 Putative DNA-binding domain-containing protein [Halopelagius longus]
MKRRETTQDLLEIFGKSPGAESSDLEFKSLEILNTKGQKKKLVRVLSAIANGGGGTVIIGVRREGDDIRLQDVSVDREIRQELTHIAQNYASPALTDLWEIKFEEHMGNNLLRIDIDKATVELIKFDYEGEWRVFIREEDGMREMSSGEISEFYKKRKQRQSSAYKSKIEQIIHANYTPPVDLDREYPDTILERAITRVDPNYTAVCGHAVMGDRMGKSVSYHLETNVSSHGSYGEIISLLQSADECLNADLGRSLGYTFRIADMQLMGMTINGLREDLSRIAEIQDTLEEYTRKGWDYGPVLAGYTSTDVGIFWFELQKETSSFLRGNIGFILPDIPIEDSPLRDFLTENASLPPNYNHQHGLRFIHLNGHGLGPLNNPVPVEIGEHEGLTYNHLITDNPLYDWPEEVQEAAESPVPEWLMHGISSVERLPSLVSGGYLDDDERFSLNYLSYTQVSGTHPTVLVDVSTRALDTDEISIKSEFNL